MALHEKQIGRGSKPETCALSGKPLAPEDMYMIINGVQVGVKARFWRGQAQEERDALIEAWAKDLTVDAGRKNRRGVAADAPEVAALDIGAMVGE